MTTLMELRRLTRNRLGVPISDDFFGDPVLDDHINLAVQAIEGEYHWPWSDAVDVVTISSDEPDFPQPDGYRATRAIFDGENELYAVSPGDLMSYVTVTGELSRVWCPIGNVIAVRPIVNRTRDLKHFWYRQPTWLDDDRDIPTIPSQFMGAIIAKAAELLSSREGAGADASRHSSEYNEWLTRMRRDVRRTTMPTRVRVRPGGWI